MPGPVGIRSYRPRVRNHRASLPALLGVLLALTGWSDDLPTLWHLPLLVVEGQWRKVNATAAGQAPIKSQALP